MWVFVKTRYRSIFGVPIGVRRFVKLLENAPLFRVIFWRISRIFGLKRRRFRAMRRQIFYQIPRNISEVLAVEKSSSWEKEHKNTLFSWKYTTSDGISGAFPHDNAMFFRKKKKKNGSERPLNLHFIELLPLFCPCSSDRKSEKMTQKSGSLPPYHGGCSGSALSNRGIAAF